MLFYSDKSLENGDFVGKIGEKKTFFEKKVRGMLSFLRKGVERRRSRPLERANVSERVKRLTVREPRKARPAAAGGRMRPE